MKTEISFILQSIKNSGFEGRIVGGYVRDFILGIESSDIDIATTATPQQIINIFQNLNCNVIPTGLSHGTVTVIKDSIPFEITTLREDIETDGRHAKIKFSKSWEQDAARRDFTFNALYMDIDGKIYDFFNGVKDLRDRKICFINDPEKRIQEDFLRILRYFRFSAKMQIPAQNKGIFEIFRKHAAQIKTLSRERIKHEMLKISFCDNFFETLHQMYSCNILQQIIDIDEENFKKILNFHKQNPKLLNFALLSCDNIATKFSLFSNTNNLAENLILSKIEKKCLQFLNSSVEFGCDSTLNIARNLFFYHNNKFIFEKMIFELLNSCINDNSQPENQKYLSFEKKLSFLIREKSIYFAVNSKYFCPIQARDVMPFCKKSADISKYISIMKKFWSKNLSKPSVQDCLDFLKKHLDN